MRLTGQVWLSAIAAAIILVGVIVFAAARGCDEQVVGELRVISSPQGRILYETGTGTITVLVNGEIEHPRRIEFV